MSRHIFVKSIPKTWTNQDNNGSMNWEDPKTGKKLNKTKIGIGNGTILCANYSQKVNGYATGLYKPWIDNGAQKMEKGRALTLQDYYEKKHNVPEGTYTNRATILDMYDTNPDNKKRTYYELETAHTFLDGTTILDMDIPKHELVYEYLLESPLVANSEKEWREHKWPKAIFYIAMENESDEIKYSRTAKLTKAMAELHNSELTLPVKRQMLAILDISNARTVLTEEQVHNLLFDYLERSTSTPGNNIDKFMELAGLLKTAKGKLELEAKFFLKKLVDYRVLQVKQDSYTWLRPNGPMIIGETYREALDYLLNDKKGAVHDELRFELTTKD